MTYYLSNKYTKNYCDRTILVQLIVEVVVAYFFLKHGVYAYVMYTCSKYNAKVIIICCQFYPCKSLLLSVHECIIAHVYLCPNAPVRGFVTNEHAAFSYNSPWLLLILHFVCMIAQADYRHPILLSGA